MHRDDDPNVGFRNNIGQVRRCRALRLAKGFTQVDLARKLGYAASAIISMAEKGWVAPSLREPLAAELGCDPDSLEDFVDLGVADRPRPANVLALSAEEERVLRVARKKASAILTSTTSTPEQREAARALLISNEG